MAAARFLVSGKVQGVCFRASTREQAQRLGLRGHDRNLSDGRVEVLAAGEPEAIDALADWLQRGPPQARGEAVEREAATDDARTSFRIRCKQRTGADPRPTDRRGSTSRAGEQNATQRTKE